MILRLERCLPLLFVAIGACLLALAAYFHFAPPAGPALEVDASNLELADCVPGQKREVLFQLENCSRRPLRVVGLAVC